MTFPRPLPHMMKPKTILADMIVEDTTETPLWEVLVPTVSNTGKPFSVRHHRQWDAMVKNIAGGMTLVQPVRGSWVDPETETEYTERVIPVRIMCDRAQIIEICKETARFYDQLAVLATLVASETVLVTNPHATGASCGECWACIDREGLHPAGYVLCPDCGNKRCPKASDHLLDCTGSNEPGQPGVTRYPRVPSPVNDDEGDRS